jgi:hypothetical protein
MFIIKRLRELRSVFQHSFQAAPCLKFSTKGPLSLRDLQQLAVSHSERGSCLGGLIVEESGWPLSHELLPSVLYAAAQ